MGKISKSKDHVIELRPHNILAFPNYSNPKINYFAYFRKVKGNFHSDKLIKHWIKIIRSLHENPDLKFKYVRGIDSVCKECEHRKECSNPKHINYKLAKDADKDAIKQMPELKFGKIYDGKFLKKMFNKKLAKVPKIRELNKK
jgi:hypothetical protein